MVVIGTRPEAIKLCPVIKEMEKHPGDIEPVIVGTGQHREMLDQFLKLFNLTLAYDLKVMEDNQSLATVTSKVLLGIDEIIKKVAPDIVLVQGDTTSAFAAGLVAFYHKIAVGHVEAGLRTFKKYYPHPEEVNRSLLSCFTDLHFAPTKTAAENLSRQGVPADRIFITGNTVIDALFHTIDPDFKWKTGTGAVPKRLVLVTAHRRENFGKPLENICAAIKALVRNNPDIEVIYPVHLNPNVQKIVYKSLGNVRAVQLIPPLDYVTFVNLMAKSYLILTDSGGIQEEAPSLGIPVLVLREETERPEAVAAGVARLVGTNRLRIVRSAQELLDDRAAYSRMSRGVNPYGDGKASRRIVKTILSSFSAGAR